MKPVQINIVYQNNNMPADVLPPMAAPTASATVTWSRHPQPGADAVVYFNHYTYHRKLHERLVPNALRILYMYEPVTVDPIQYGSGVWRQFDAIFTWNTYLTEASEVFRFDPGMYYDLPYTKRYGVRHLPEALPDPATRERAMCQICGDKYSLMPEELYSERRRIARWFHRKGRMRMDVFGLPPAHVPNYRGACEDKAATFASYRFALCFENTHHPRWSRGYVTEKLLDCLYSLTVPVYFGASDIEAIVPRDCYIDFREFASVADLDSRLIDMTDLEWLGYVDNILRFLKGYDAPRRHSAHRLYEAVATLCRGPRPPSPASVPLPEDYLADAGLSARLRFLITRAVLPHYRYVYPIFGLIRRVRSLGGQS